MTRDTRPGKETAMNNAPLWWDRHLEEYIETLKRYVAFRSVAVPGKDGLPFGRDSLEMLRFMESQMKGIGMEAHLVNDVFAEGRIRGISGKKSIAVACHGEVVPAEGEWERDPFELYQKEDHLVGRGATDNKGAGIAVLFAFRYLIESGWKPGNDFILRIGSAEEIGMQDVPLAFADTAMPDLTLVPDSGFPVAYGEKGSIKAEIRLGLTDSRISMIKGGGAASVIDLAECISDAGRITAHGKGRHPATPEGGEDAMLNLMNALEAAGFDDEAVRGYISLFPDFYGTGLGIDCSDEESGRLTAVVTEVRTEDLTLVCTLSIRLPLSADAERIKKILEEKGASVLSSTTGYRVEPDTLIMGLNDIANKAYGSSKPPYVMAGGTYARVMQKAVAFGMGSPLGNAMPPFPAGQGRAHQRNESVQIERMKKGFLIYAEALQYLDRNI